VSGVDPSERRNLAVIGRSYGIAGAIEYYAPEFAPVYSTHNNYYLWGPPPDSTRVFVIVGGRADDVRSWFERVVLSGESRCDVCYAQRRRVPIWIAHNPTRPLAELWRSARLYL
jgi:hypothetical protein